MGQVPDGDTIVRPASSSRRTAQATAPTAWSGPRDPRSWLLLATTLLALTAARMIVVHAVADMVDVGFEPLFAAAVFGAVGLVQAPATVGWGWVSDRVGRVGAFALGSVCVIAAIALLLVIQGNPQPAVRVALRAGVRIGRQLADFAP